MGAFSTKTVLSGNVSLIPLITDKICKEFAAQGYEVHSEPLLSGGADVSITKGNLFKAALGMRTALKITLIPLNNGISFEAGVGIFGQQVVPTIIMWFFAWPVLLTQIWGLIQQAKLDDKALEIANHVIKEAINTPKLVGKRTIFCTSCGTSISIQAKFCPNCGEELL